MKTYLINQDSMIAIDLGEGSNYQIPPNAIALNEVAAVALIAALIEDIEGIDKEEFLAKLDIEKLAKKIANQNELEYIEVKLD